jgi:hypothetical protein
MMNSNNIIIGLTKYMVLEKFKFPLNLQSWRAFLKKCSAADKIYKKAC